MNKLRNFIERKADEWLFANRRSKYFDIYQVAIVNRISSQQIAETFGGQNVLMGIIYLLAANHMKKSGIRPEKG